MRPFARRLELNVPDGIDTVVIDPPPGPCGGERLDLVWNGHESEGRLGEPFALELSQNRRLLIRLIHDAAIDPHQVATPRAAPLSYLRRLAIEARDRFHPLAGPSEP